MADITHSPAVAGHRHGVWKGSRGLANAARTPRVRAEDSRWDPAWICEQSSKHFERLPARNLARQHSGWKVDDLEDEVDDSRHADTHVENATPATHFPYPTMSLPPPCMEFDFRMAVRSDGRTTPTTLPGGSRPVELSRVIGGSWSGSFGQGQVIAGGYYLERVTAEDEKIYRVNGLFKLRTSADQNAAEFEVRTRGFLNNPDSNSDDVESSEGGESLNRKKYNYRMFLDVGSTDEQLGQTFGSALWVGTGIWKQNELVIDAYRVA
ncbi:hypothetical protein Cob_v006862 [Colletotrichum orbiculare MAFF 240422]|uniref:Uncharacterized protein n=1 Tax=Colletotrichum orbiculare (strain 104-T / ATCC 96160 / CBS 514.97 / LARS 414 / MAFF 240422) TaxID=1213857 RepID=A0A484FP30_COLOR|nr:hypothetical protein Cob_v006862 [Colletotrichum orbiculare MAFF 240422]